MPNGNGAPDAAHPPAYLLPPIMTVDGAIARMEALDAYIKQKEPRRAHDGVAQFNRLYTVITRRVKEGIDNGVFDDPNFLITLDIQFANRYFDALRVGAQNLRAMPRSWKVLVEKRGELDVHPLQFAVAGVNAHINYDLAAALQSTWEILGTKPGDGRQHDDYDRINDIFADEMGVLRQSFEDEWERNADAVAAPVLNAVGTFSIEAAREAAWEFGEKLHEARADDFLRGFLTKWADGIVAFVNHGLLVQVPGGLGLDFGDQPSPSPDIGLAVPSPQALSPRQAGHDPGIGL